MNATMTNMVENRSRHAVRDGFRNDMAERYLSVRSVQKRLRSGSAARHGVRGPAHCLAAFFASTSVEWVLWWMCACTPSSPSSRITMIHGRSWLRLDSGS
jgi:hypothetical protein